MISVIKDFERGNVCVTGLRGRGKDMLIANVVCRRNLPYVSNVDYGGTHYPLDLDKLSVGYNCYKDFINGTVKKYEYPYGDDVDVYISDVGVYFPSQFCSELNRDYKHLPVAMALSRQLGFNVHTNCQNLNRQWDKIREQSDIYYLCRWCKVLPGGIVIQAIRKYEKADSCQNRVPPFSVKLPLVAFLDWRMRVHYDLQRQSYYSTHGDIKDRILIYRNKSKYNTRIFQEVLKNGI